MKPSSSRAEMVPKSTINKTNRKATNKSRHRSNKPNITNNMCNVLSGNVSGSIHLNKATSSAATAYPYKTSKLNSPSESAGAIVFHDVAAGGISSFQEQSFINDSATPTATGTVTGVKQEISLGGNETAITPKHSVDNSVVLQNYNKNYVGLDARSIKTIWEQHDQNDVELSNEVCARLAEDVSHKLWELINVRIF